MNRGAKKWRLIFVAVVLIGLLAAAYWAWRVESTRSLVAGNLPATPALSAFPSALQERVSTAEREVLTGWRPVKALGELAGLYHANGFYSEASQIYTELLRVDASNPRWSHLLGGILAGYGRLDEALPQLRRTVALAPEYLPAQIRLSDALLKNNLSAEAARIYGAVLAREPANIYAQLGFARIEMNAEKWDAARARVQRVVDAQPAFGSAWFLLATIDEKLGDKSAAITDREKVGKNGRFREMADPWTDALMEDCYDVYRLRVVAGVASNSDDTVTARHWLERALSLAPANASVERQLGNLYVQTGQLPEARRHLERAVELVPDDADNWNYLIAALTTIGDEAAAERALANGLARCPQSPSLHYERGRRLSTAKRFDEATAELNEARRLRPEMANAYVELAMIDFQLGRIEEGVAEFRGALAVEPNHSLALVALARYAIDTGDSIGARGLLQRARQQPKVLRQDLDGMVAAFQEKFGQLPW